MPVLQHNTLAPGIDTGQQDQRGVYTRCPIPPIGLGSVDNLRQYYNRGLVPLYRAQVINTTPLGGQTTVNTIVQTSSGSSSNSSSSGSSSSSSGSSGTQPSATPAGRVFTASATTATLNLNQSYSGTVTLAKSYAILTVAVTNPARIRVYTSQSAANNDSGRPATTPVVLGNQTGLVGEWLLQDPSEFVWSCSPAAIGYNADQPASPTAFIVITNPLSSSNNIQVSFTYVSLES